MYFLQIPSNHVATTDVHESKNLSGSQQYLIPVLQSIETESQLQLILDVNVESPVMKELLRSPNNCQIPGLPQEQELNLETLNSLLINASDLKFISSDKVCKENLDEPYKKQDEIIDELTKKCIGSNYISVFDSNVLPRSVLSLPPPLVFQKGVVVSRRTIPAFCKFGPVKGLRNTVSKDEANELLAKSGHDNRPVYLINKEDSIIHIDVTDQDKSNWFSFLALGKTEDANLWINQDDDGELYAVNVKSIPPRTEIIIGYSLDYLGIYGKFEAPQTCHNLPVMDFDMVKPVKSYQTLLHERCNKKRTKHKPGLSKLCRSKRAPYKCKLCGSRFVRQYTLNRHIRKSCSKNVDTLIISSDKGTSTNSAVTQAVPTTEDFKPPSDDSFGTLDFPTNLLDAERISNLDLSVRSDEFGLCAIGGRDENCLNDALVKMNFNTQLLSTCADCGQIIVTEKSKAHFRLCPAKKFRCKCGEKFISQKLLNTHKNRDHETENNQERYACEDCNISFKRRGMLVNHEHKSHGRDVSPALYKCIVRYKCPACTNVYSTVAKRNQHVQKHHPGVDPKAGEIVKSGRSKRVAVKCTDCYRQYSTRAKMLQHWRASHANSQAGVDPKAGKTVKPGRWSCTDCFRQYSRRARMLQHWRACHAASHADSTTLPEKPKEPLLIS